MESNSRAPALKMNGKERNGPSEEVSFQFVLKVVAGSLFHETQPFSCIQKMNLLQGTMLLSNFNQSINQFIKIHKTKVHASVRIAWQWLHVFKQTIINKIFLI